MVKTIKLIDIIQFSIHHILKNINNKDINLFKIENNLKDIMIIINQYQSQNNK